MADRHDDVDAWLSERIEPLPPPPGTFDLIRPRARRRKYRKLGSTAGSAAVIVAAAVAVPQVVNLPVLNPTPTAAPVAGAQSSSVTADKSAPRQASGSASPVTSSAVPLTSPVPGNFRPTSVTFVGLRTGWVIGQGLTPGHCATQFCTSVARTDDAGRTWTGVPAPMAGAADGATGLTDGAASEAAQLVLTGSRGYLLAPGGALYAGPVDGSGPWTRVSSLVASCPVGPARADGQPTGALLGAVNASDLILACASASSGSNPSVSTQQKFIYSSKNGGVSWQQLATAPAAGVAFGLAASPSESVVLATNQGIDLLPASEMAWRKANVRGGAPAGGFRYIGMTTGDQGIALPADPSAGTIWFTFDGGQSWKAS